VNYDGKLITDISNSKYNYPILFHATIISRLDEQLGEIVQKLKDEGVYDDTIIMICSDNCPAFNAGVGSLFFNRGGHFQGES
jgi:arylsulfatase